MSLQVVSIFFSFRFHINDKATFLHGQVDSMITIDVVVRFILNEPSNFRKIIFFLFIKWTKFFSQEKKGSPVILDPSSAY